MNPSKLDKGADSDIDIPKAMKKSAINWAVPLFGSVLLMAFLALGRAQVNAMLENYQPKSQAVADKAELNTRIDALARQLEDVRVTLYQMDKKLDHLQYVIDYNQERNKLANPKP